MKLFLLYPHTMTNHIVQEEQSTSVRANTEHPYQETLKILIGVFALHEP